MKRTSICYRFLSLVLACFVLGSAVLVFLIMSANNREPTEHTIGDRINLSMSPMISKRSIVRWPYYSYRFPRGPGDRSVSQSTIDAFSSTYQNGNSGFRHVAWEEPAKCYAQSTLDNKTEMYYNDIELGAFVKAIQDGYRIMPVISGVRVISKHPKGGWWWGYDIGAVIGTRVLLYNHVKFDIDVDTAGRVVKVIAEPRHTNSLELCGDSSNVPNHPTDMVRWSYETKVRVTSQKYKDIDKNINKIIAPEEKNLRYMLLSVVGLVFVVSIGLCGLVLYRAYRHNRFDVDDLKNATSNLLKKQEAIHTTDDVELQDIHRDEDIANFDLLIEDDTSAKYKLAQFRRPILGPPSWPQTFATLVAGYLQFIVAVFLSMLISTLYQHSWNDAYQVITILILPCTGFVSGFVYTWLTTKWTRTRADGTSVEMGCGCWSHWGVIVVVTLPLYVVFFMVTSMQVLYDDRATKFNIGFILLALMVLNGLTYMTGVNLAKAFPPARHILGRAYLPDPTESRVRHFSLNVILCVVVAAIQGAGGVFVGHMMMSEPWSTRVKQQILFMTLFLFLWICAGAFLSTFTTFVSVIYVRQPRWHWVTYSMGASTSVVVFVVSMTYIMDQTTFVDNSNYVAVTVYLLVTSLLVGQACGAINWLSAHLFFEAIYHKIVYKD